MAGMSRTSGRVLSDVDHIRQSVADIITTPIGSRVMRRTYGSHVAELIDAPGNAVGALRMVAAAADALERWEPRARLLSASVAPGADGRAVMRMQLEILPTSETLTATVALGGAA